MNVARDHPYELPGYFHRPLQYQNLRYLMCFCDLESLMHTKHPTITPSNILLYASSRNSIVPQEVPGKMIEELVSAKEDQKKRMG